MASKSRPMTPVELLYALGVKQIRPRGAEISASCPFHDDRHPSFSINGKTGQWYCHAGCGSGNATTLLARFLQIETGQAHARLMEGRPWTPVHQRALYVRKTSRCGGSMRELELQLHASELIQQKMPRPKAARALMERFGISRSTAYRRLRAVQGKAIVVERHGRRIGVRTLHVLKRMRQRLRAVLQNKISSRPPYQDEKLRQIQARASKVDLRKHQKRPGRGREGPVYVAHGRFRTQFHPLFNPLL
jgi:hypothetical protein